LRLHFEQRHAPLHDADDATWLCLVAFEREGSVFDLFVAAGKTWSFSRAKVECDFNDYLKQGVIPHYVNAYVRRHRTKRPSYQSTLFIGSDLPPSASP